VTSAVTSNPPTRLRVQFSLATLLLCVIAAGACIGIGLSWREIEKLSRDVRGLREEAGYLDVSDPSRLWVRAINVGTDKSLHWRWRLYVPKAGRYCICCQFDKIDNTGFDPSRAQNVLCELPSEQVTLDVSIKYTERDGTRVPELRIVAPGVTKSLPSAWPLDRLAGMWRKQGILGQQSESFAPHQRVALLRAHAELFSGGAMDYPQMLGVLIWLEEDPAK